MDNDPLIIEKTNGQWPDIEITVNETNPDGFVLRVLELRWVVKESNAGYPAHSAAIFDAIKVALENRE